jgi:predicted RNA-binding protein with PUA-like domain
MPKRYWLMKSEPGVFSIDDLAAAPRRTVFWDGVRNYQARNLLRDELKPGDGVFFYHSSVDPPSIVGTARVVSGGAVDPTQFEPRDPHFDPDSRAGAPRWFGVEVRFERKFSRPLPLAELRGVSGLKNLVLLKRSRLSVQPVSASEWDAILELGAD